MMAKEPRDRYQRAEHLVQHLIQVAQKLGAVTDVPDGVLFVDAPLPAPPRKRPLLMAAVGALALAAFLVALSFTPGRTGGSRAPKNSQAQADDKKAAPDQGPSKDSQPKGVEVPEGQGAYLVTSEEEFKAALASPAPHLHLTLSGTI